MTDRRFYLLALTIAMSPVSHAAAVEVSLTSSSMSWYFEFLEIYVFPFILAASVALLLGYGLMRVFGKSSEDEDVYARLKPVDTPDLPVIDVPDVPSTDDQRDAPSADDQRKEPGFARDTEAKGGYPESAVADVPDASIAREQSDETDSSRDARLNADVGEESIGDGPEGPYWWEARGEPEPARAKDSELAGEPGVADESATPDVAPMDTESLLERITARATEQETFGQKRAPEAPSEDVANLSNSDELVHRIRARVDQQIMDAVDEAAGMPADNAEAANKLDALLRRIGARTTKNPTAKGDEATADSSRVNAGENGSPNDELTPAERLDALLARMNTPASGDVAPETAMEAPSPTPESEEPSTDRLDTLLGRLGVRDADKTAEDAEVPPVETSSTLEESEPSSDKADELSKSAGPAVSETVEADTAEADTPLGEAARPQSEERAAELDGEPAFREPRMPVVDVDFEPVEPVISDEDLPDLVLETDLEDADRETDDADAPRVEPTFTSTDTSTEEMPGERAVSPEMEADEERHVDFSIDIAAEGRAESVPDTELVSAPDGSDEDISPLTPDSDFVSDTPHENRRDTFDEAAATPPVEEFGKTPPESTSDTPVEAESSVLEKPLADAPAERSEDTSPDAEPPLEPGPEELSTNRFDSIIERMGKRAAHETLEDGRMSPADISSMREKEEPRSENFEEPLEGGDAASSEEPEADTFEPVVPPDAHTSPRAAESDIETPLDSEPRASSVEGVTGTEDVEPVSAPPADIWGSSVAPADTLPGEEFDWRPAEPSFEKPVDIEPVESGEPSADAPSEGSVETSRQTERSPEPETEVSEGAKVSEEAVSGRMTEETMEVSTKTVPTEVTVESDSGSFDAAEPTSADAGEPVTPEADENETPVESSADRTEAASPAAKLDELVRRIGARVLGRPDAASDTSGVGAEFLKTISVPVPKEADQTDALSEDAPGLDKKPVDEQGVDGSDEGIPSEAPVQETLVDREQEENEEVAGGPPVSGGKSLAIEGLPEDREAVVSEPEPVPVVASLHGSGDADMPASADPGGESESSPPTGEIRESVADEGAKPESDAAVRLARRIVSSFDTASAALERVSGLVDGYETAREGLDLEALGGMKLTNVGLPPDAEATLRQLDEEIPRALLSGFAAIDRFNHIVDQLCEMAADAPLDEGWNELLQDRIQETITAVDGVCSRLHAVAPEPPDVFDDASREARQERDDRSSMGVSAGGE